MPAFSLKKPAPPAVVILSGFSVIAFYIFETFHSLRPPVVTPLYLVLDDFVPGILFTVMVLWGFWASPRKGVLQVLLVLTLLISWVDLVGSYILMVGKTTPQLMAMIRNFSMGQFLFWVVLVGINREILYFLTGWTFYKKKPWCFPYGEVDPLQNVLFKFVGVLWVLDAFYRIFHTFFSIQAFRNHFF